MLIRELILHHLGAGAVHQRGYSLPSTQTPGIRLHPVGAQVEPEPGDLLLVSAPADGQLAAAVGTDLPDGTTVVLLVATEPAALPVGRIVNALLGAGLKLIEAVVASGTRQPTVAVVARRTNQTLLPQPYLARELEPALDADAEHGAAALARVLAEGVLENLSQRARERELLRQLGEAEAGQRTAEQGLDELRPLTEELDQLKSELAMAKSELATVKSERSALRKRLGQVESSTTYRLASRLARGSGRVRRFVPRRGK